MKATPSAQLTGSFGSTFQLSTKTPTKASKDAARIGGSVLSLPRPPLDPSLHPVRFEGMMGDTAWIAGVAARAMTPTRRHEPTIAATTSAPCKWMMTFTDKEASPTSALHFRNARCTDSNRKSRFGFCTFCVGAKRGRNRVSSTPFSISTVRRESLQPIERPRRAFHGV